MNANEDSGFAGLPTEPEWNDAAKVICRQHGLPADNVLRCPSSDHIVFAIGDEHILKIYRPVRSCFERERNALIFAGHRSPIAMTEMIGEGRHRDRDYLLMTRLSGRTCTRAEFLSMPESVRMSTVRQLADGLKRMHNWDASELENDWEAFIADRSATLVRRQIEHGVNGKIIAELPRFLEDNLRTIAEGPAVFLHGDVHFGNLRLDFRDPMSPICGIFDLADSRRGHFEYDFVAVGVLMLQGERELQREFFLAYGYRPKELDETMRRRLMMLTMLYETADLRRYALRLRPEAVELDLGELERAIWCFV